MRYEFRRDIRHRDWGSVHRVWTTHHRFLWWRWKKTHSLQVNWGCPEADWEAYARKDYDWLMKLAEPHPTVTYL